MNVDLARELKKLWNMKVTFIPILIGAFGIVTKGLIKEPEDMQIRGLVETIQTTTLLRSTRILRRVMQSLLENVVLTQRRYSNRYWPLRIRVEIWIMAIKEYFRFLKAPGLEPPHQLPFNVISRYLIGSCLTPFVKDSVGVFHSSSLPLLKPSKLDEQNMLNTAGQVWTNS